MWAIFRAVKRWFSSDFTEDDGDDGWNPVMASSFADPKDVSAFRRCKATGRSDMECFKVGDNGLGYFIDESGKPAPCWRDDQNFAALPREVWAAKWGNRSNAALRSIEVRHNGKVVRGRLGDTMPSLKNIKNGAGIDLNPGFAKSLGLKPPFLKRVEWRWVD